MNISNAVRILDDSELLQGWQSRNKLQSDAFFTAAYDDIYRIVENLRRYHAPARTLLHSAGTTELTHEAILKLNRWRQDETPLSQRKDFLDYVRCSVWHLLFAKNEYQQAREHLKADYYLSQNSKTQSFSPNFQLNHDLQAALKSLKERHPKEAQAFEYKHFSACSNREIAEVLEISERTVNSRIKFATDHLRMLLA
ncbi:ECF-type sigma factor [Shewanella sp. 4_MG-2023]|uniref:ECF-type sigma factor n=1 Tax=Shewanella sp. 4_MG-2023 TaxID=3062652 RepID=UPI0026E15E79|nr:ECF-type sigma factor [Shewanella sp. 4_MG-2023]MDO6677077.1 ECF-type sigma factor [Shewanella sp. 4_MG-2023]